MTQKIENTRYRYHKTITISLNESDIDLIESAVAYISFVRKRTLPLTHFIRFIIRNYSDAAKNKFIDEKVNGVDI